MLNQKETQKSKPAPKKTNQKETEFYSPSIILFVGDSHSNNLDTRGLEDATNAKVDNAIAYTVDEDIDARIPRKNFSKVVPERLSKKNYDTLVLQGGCNEITNINLNVKAPVNEWQEKIKISRIKMFELAQSSLEKHPHLKKVIIVKSLPRYDPKALKLI